MTERAPMTDADWDDIKDDWRRTCEAEGERRERARVVAYARRYAYRFPIGNEARVALLQLEDDIRGGDHIEDTRATVAPPIPATPQPGPSTIPAKHHPEQ